MTKVEQALRLLRDYDYHWQYIDYGALGAKKNNERIIADVIELNLSKSQLIRVLKEIFGKSKEEFESMKKTFKV